MKIVQELKRQSENRSKNPWVYIMVLLVNIALISSIAFAYYSSGKANTQMLFNENIRSVDSLNTATANAAYTYTKSMETKVADLISLAKSNNYTLKQLSRKLGESNTDSMRQLQLIKSADFDAAGNKIIGDYTGVSIRRLPDTQGADGIVATSIAYGDGYNDMYKYFADLDDRGTDGLCFTSEFTDPDTKKKCFATYRHIELFDENGDKGIYTMLVVVNADAALSLYNVQAEYEGQSSVLVDKSGAYIIKSSDYRNNNFYDYIVNYNGLTASERAAITAQISTQATELNSVNLFYKNYKGDDCVYTVNSIKSGWYSITCVPLSSFVLDDNTVDYSAIILTLFIALFIADGVAILFTGRILKYNIGVAEKATMEANSANEAKSRFLSTMSHELRTPLNAIIGLVSLSEDSLDNPPVIKDYLKKIDMSSKLLLQLISDILDVSAIESNKMKLNSTEFDVAKLITALSVIYYDQCTSKDVEFDVSIKDITSTMLVGDSVRLNQILLNFLSNAVKFTPAGGKVTLRAQQISQNEGDVVIRFEVADTGVGISEELMGRLFKPFERAKGDTARKFSGSGLGLSIAKNLVELMHGTIGVDSEEGVGTTFFAEIPFHVSEDAGHRTFSPIKNIRTLSVIRDAGEREYIENILSNFGVEHIAASDMDEGKRLLRSAVQSGHFVDLCIFDCHMNGSELQETVTEVKSIFPKGSVRTMVLAYNLAGAASICTKAGVDFVLGKPIFPSSMYNALEEVANNSVEPISIPDKAVDLSGRRVLLVEDNKLNTEIAELLLGKAGMTVETAENGQLGVDKFLSSPKGYYDVVLMDIQMPVMNGYEAAKAIRSSTHEDAGTVPILAMTADAFREDVQRAKDAGMNEHIPKPVVTKDLYAILKSYLN